MVFKNQKQYALIEGIYKRYLHNVSYLMNGLEKLKIEFSGVKYEFYV